MWYLQTFTEIESSTPHCSKYSDAAAAIFSIGHNISLSSMIAAQRPPESRSLKWITYNLHLLLLFLNLTLEVCWSRVINVYTRMYSTNTVWDQNVHCYWPLTKYWSNLCPSAVLLQITNLIWTLKKIKGPTIALFECTLPCMLQQLSGLIYA